MRALKKIAVGVVLLSGFFLGGFGLFCYDLTHMSSALLSPPEADAIVVLTGGPGRVATGLDLLEQKKGKRLLITGVNTDVKPREILPSTHLPVDLGYHAQNTLENAQEARAWAFGHGYKSLIIVTSSYHMRRSLLEFSQRLGEISLIPHPVSPASHKLSQISLGQAWIQYGKYILALGRALVRGCARQLGLG
jgi:uncharacterized SAM-binding protein YcdF (DUF218 family)